MMKSTIALVLLAAAIAPSAQAQDQRAERAKQQFQKRFQAADANGDGKLTKEEAKDKMPMVYKNFEAIDTRQTGFVTPADIATWYREHQGAK